jgi:multiple sugar transport system permease protein
MAMSDDEQAELAAADGVRRRWRIGSKAYPLIMISPAVILIMSVSFIPIGYAIVQSFYRSSNLSLGRYVGFSNYSSYLFHLNGIGTIFNSLTFVIGTAIIALPLGFVLACVLSNPIPFRSALRTILILPWLVSNLVGALMWSWLGNPQYGLAPYLLKAVGITMPNIISNPTAAMASIIVASAWASFPLVMVFVLAALQTVPRDLTEAAQIDGASSRQRFIHITFPLVRNTTMIALILVSLHAFKNVEIALVMTGGGPDGATETMPLKVFREAFTIFRIGVGSAGAVMIFILNLFFTLAFVRVLRTEHGA